MVALDEHYFKDALSEIVVKKRIIANALFEPRRPGNARWPVGAS